MEQKDLDKHMNELRETVTKCRNEVQAVMDRYQMDLDVAFVLRAGSVEPKISFVPRQTSAPEEPVKRKKNTD